MVRLILWLCELTCVHHWDETRYVSGHVGGVRRCGDCDRYEKLDLKTGKWVVSDSDEYLRGLLKAATRQV